MSTELGEPHVEVAVLPEGVRLTVAATFRGDGADWEPDEAGAWLLGLWERTLAMAKLHHDYGLVLERRQPEPPALPVELPESASLEEAPPAEPLPPPAPSLSLAERIARAEMNGSLAVSMRSLKARAQQWERDALRQLRERPEGLLLTELMALDPAAAKGAIQQRMARLKQAGTVVFAPGPGRDRRWRLAHPREAAPAPSDGEGALRIDNDLAAVLPHTRGKVVLMLGGDCQPQRQKEIEATLGLQELRWPTYYQGQPIDRRLTQIRQSEVDLVLVNRFNKRYSREYQHVARDCGKPVVALTAGLGLTQIVHQLRLQWVDRLLPERRAA